MGFGGFGSLEFGRVWVIGWAVGVWVGRSSQICAAAIYVSLVIGECLRIGRYIATGCSVPLTS